jgi:hypothetical protein
MFARAMRESDIPALRIMAAGSGFPYPDLASERIEAVVVIADEDGKPVMALAAERLVQLYLYAVNNGHPAARLHAIRLLDAAMQQELLRRGYHSAEAFLPPSVAKSFGSRLVKTFGFVQNWLSYCKSF